MNDPWGTIHIGVKLIVLVSVRRYLQTKSARQEMRFIILGAFIGFLTGIISIGFKEAINWVFGLFYHVTVTPDAIISIFRDLPFYMLFLIPIAGGVFVSSFTNRYAAEAKGHGIPEVMEAVAIHRGVIRLRVIFVKMIASIISIASGASVGREGPTALVGATVGSALGRWLHLSVGRVRMIIACGASGAIAATFNAPLGGIAFALELILNEIHIQYYAPVITSAMVGTVTSHYFLGQEHQLISNLSFNIDQPSQVVYYALFGMAAGLWAVAFTRLLYYAEDTAAKLPLKPWQKGAIGGVGMGIFLVLIPEVAGPANWDVINDLVNHDLGRSSFIFLLVLSSAKIAATAWSLAFGASGGVFAPSLLIGSSFGISFGAILNRFVPAHLTTDPGSLALVGMGAFVTAATQAPLTAMTLIAELTDKHEIILPLMISGAFAYGIYNHFMTGSVYTLKLIRRGIVLNRGKDSGVLAGISVNAIAKPEAEALAAGQTVGEALAFFKDSLRSTLPVVGSDGRLLGIVSFWDLTQKTKDDDKDDALLHYAKTNYSFVTPETNLYEAFMVISDGDFEYLPVIDNPTDRRLVGMLTRGHLLRAYRQALTKRGIIIDDQKVGQPG